MSKLQTILTTLDEKKADNIKVYDLSKTEQIHQTMVICDANNLRLIQAIKDYLEEGLEKHGYTVHHSEGKHDSEWILLDVYDILIHIFLDHARWFYHLDDLWADQPHYQYKEN